jgi:thiol-disulfide isomerase/thioredoxin
MKLVYYGAEWCPTCKSMYPIVVKEMLRYGITEDSEKFEYVDVDMQMDRANYNNICNLPCMQVENDTGDVLERYVGMQNISVIKKICEKVGGNK